MKIEVTQKDINAGQCNVSTACAIALAARRVMPPEFDAVDVDDKELVFFQRRGPKWTNYKLPPEASDFVRKFDRNRLSVKPFTFEIDEDN